MLRTGLSGPMNDAIRLCAQTIEFIIIDDANGSERGINALPERVKSIHDIE